MGEYEGKGLLHGQRVLVTGGSGGIGRGICQVAAREGAKVAFTWLSNEQGAHETADLCGKAALPVHVDLADPTAPKRLIAAVQSHLGGLDVLINNAAVSEAVAFMDVSEKHLDELLQINLVAPIHLTQEALRPMIQQRYGRVVNMSSIAGSRAVNGPVHYAASKGGLEGFTRSLAQEVGPHGILVNAVAAGMFEGGLRSAIPPEFQERYLVGNALSRFGTPVECGELVAWLASPRNTYVNGAVLFQDGGALG